MEMKRKNRRKADFNFKVSSHSALSAVSIVIRTITFQKAAAFLLTAFVNVRVVAGRSRC